jgi:hypothetical protein
LNSTAETTTETANPMIIMLGTFKALPTKIVTIKRKIGKILMKKEGRSLFTSSFVSLTLKVANVSPFTKLLFNVNFIYHKPKARATTAPTIPKSGAAASVVPKYAVGTTF